MDCVRIIIAAVTSPHTTVSGRSPNSEYKSGPKEFTHRMEFSRNSEPPRPPARTMKFKGRYSDRFVDVGRIGSDCGGFLRCDGERARARSDSVGFEV